MPLDNEAYERARKEADSTYPMPKDTPGITAARYCGAAFLSFLSLEFLLPIAGLWWAEAITLLLAALIGWFETQSVYRQNGRLFQKLYQLYQRDSR